MAAGDSVPAALMKIMDSTLFRYIERLGALAIVAVVVLLGLTQSIASIRALEERTGRLEQTIAAMESTQVELANNVREFSRGINALTQAINRLEGVLRRP